MPLGFPLPASDGSPRLARSPRAAVLLTTLLVACGGESPAPRSPESTAAETQATQPTRSEQAAASVPACASQRWLLISPTPDEEFHYGASSGMTADQAVLQAKRTLAEAIETNLSSTVGDSQQMAERISSNGARQHIETTDIRSAVKLTVEQRLRDCQTRELCRDPAGIHALVACSRWSPLERELLHAARRIAEQAPKDGTVLAIPGVESPNTITALSEYASSSIADRIPSGTGGARIVPISNWSPSSLADAAKHAGAKYLLRTEYRDAGGQRYHFSAFIQEAATRARVGTAASFDVQLEPWQLALLSPIGPLEPQGEASPRPALHFSMNKTDLREGEEAELTFTPGEDSYVYIYDVLEDARIVLLSPNECTAPAILTGGHAYVFPDARQKEHQLRLTACPLPGHAMTREAYKIVTSPTPLELPGTATLATNLEGGTQGTRGDLDKAIRELLGRGARVAQQDVQFVIHADSTGNSPCAKK